MDAQVWIFGFLAAMVLFQIVAIPALIYKKNDLADVMWGPAFPLSAYAAVYWGVPGGFSDLDLRSWFVLSLITIWSIRLFLHVGVRNLKHRAEDVRYNNWRKQWGKKNEVWRSYLQVFILQPVILFVFLSSVLLVLASPSQATGVLFYLGVGIWIFGFVFETLSDEQLRRFKADPTNKGVLMTKGLWSWSRHPNYFGEVLQWWGIWVIALELPMGWATILSPLGVTFLILKVSGVEMLEDLMKSRSGFADYEKRTSKFIPWPPQGKDTELS